MGSYLTIVNDTDDNWDCKVGPDMKALKIGVIIVGTLSAIAATIATLGVATPWIAGMSSIIGASTGAISVLGVPAAALAMVSNTIAGATAITAGVLGGASAFSLGVAKVVGNELNDRGFDKILAHKSKRYGKMTLSLWQQSECKKTILNTTTVEVETLFMRPIFSGSTKNSNRDHKISWWLKKDGATKETIQAVLATSRVLQEDTIEYNTL